MSTDAERRETARAYFHASADTKRRTAEACEDAIVAAADLIAQAFRADGKVLICGNGGSAADCQHMAAEFVSRLTKDFERPGLPAIALTTDSSFLTAFANDCGFDGVFERQVQALGRPGDVVVVEGRNGVGKSTLLQLAVGVLRPTRGRVSGRPRVVGWVPERFPAEQ